MSYHIQKMRYRNRRRRYARWFSTKNFVSTPYDKLDAAGKARADAWIGPVVRYPRRRGSSPGRYAFFRRHHHETP